MSNIHRFTLSISIVMMLIGFGFGFALYDQPQVMFPALNHDLAAVRNLMTMLGTRSLTMALAMLIALLLRSPHALMTVLSMRALTEALDLFVIARDGPSMGMIITAAMLFVELVALALLWHSLRPDSNPVNEIASPIHN